MIDFIYLFNGCVDLLGCFAGELSYVPIADLVT